jgi:TorA maturation chaperone TorD
MQHLLTLSADPASKCCSQVFSILFIGLAQGPLPVRILLLTGSLYGRPLAGLRETLQSLGIEYVQQSQPEVHIATLCEIMAGMVGRAVTALNHCDCDFSAKHLANWGGAFLLISGVQSLPLSTPMSAPLPNLMEIENTSLAFPA